jgi:hypothetical protein
MHESFEQKAELPESGNLSDLERIFGIRRTTAYMLEAEREIQFIRLRKRGNVRGRVLVDFDSVRAYLGRLKDEQSKGRAVAE